MAQRITTWKQVSTALVLNQGQCLICQRKPPCPFEGYWEFPGGKSEKNESTFQTLTRELFEEIDIKILSAKEILCIRHAYPHTNVQLNIFVVEDYEGIVFGKEGQLTRWVHPNELKAYQTLPANDLIIDYLLSSKY